MQAMKVLRVGLRGWMGGQRWLAAAPRQRCRACPGSAAPALAPSRARSLQAPVPLPPPRTRCDRSTPGRRLTAMCPLPARTGAGGRGQDPAHRAERGGRWSVAWAACCRARPASRAVLARGVGRGWAGAAWHRVCGACHRLSCLGGSLPSPQVSAADVRKAHAIHPVAAYQLEWSLWTRDAEVGGRWPGRRRALAGGRRAAEGVGTRAPRGRAGAGPACCSRRAWRARGTSARRLPAAPRRRLGAGRGRAAVPGAGHRAGGVLAPGAVRRGEAAGPQGACCLGRRAQARVCRGRTPQPALAPAHPPCLETLPPLHRVACLLAAASLPAPSSRRPTWARETSGAWASRASRRRRLPRWAARSGWLAGGARCLAAAAASPLGASAHPVF